MTKIIYILKISFLEETSEERNGYNYTNCYKWNYKNIEKVLEDRQQKSEELKLEDQQTFTWLKILMGETPMTVNNGKLKNNWKLEFKLKAVWC